MIETPEAEPDPYAPFRCEVTYVEDRALAVPRGDVDLASAPALLREVLATLALPVTAVTLDLRHVTFIDSSGVGALITAQRKAAEHGIEFVLASVPHQVRLVLEATGLSESFGLVPRLDFLPKPKGSAA
jgi:anti-anti-sigma factor